MLVSNVDFYRGSSIILSHTNFRRIDVTVKEAADKLGVTHWVIYKWIKEKRNIGPKFEYRQGEGWFIYAKDVK